ncbi:hypothetical protein M0P98_06455 [bacterium]|nr:hypothetical protein [bacterium]
MKVLRSLKILLLICFFFSLLSTAQETLDMSELKVIKNNDTVYIRSKFSQKEDLVVQIRLGSNKQITFGSATLVNASAATDLRGFRSGKVIKHGGGDSTPWSINGTYIGADHGNSVSFALTVDNHGKTVADIGSEWLDEKENKFYLIKIVDENRLMFIGSNSPTGDIWKFTTQLIGKTLKSPSRNSTITFTERKMLQATPACRIKKQEYLVDGKTPLKDDELVTCSWLDIVEEYDIINTGSLLNDIIANPGQERNFVADHLDGVIRNEITYRFHPNGANIIYYKAKALQDFRLGYMGFIQASKAFQGKYNLLEYYIPKTLPFTKNDINYDFCKIEDYSKNFSTTLLFNEKEGNIADLSNYPDRYIQLLTNRDGDKTVREVGFALGYSLIHGISVPSVRVKNVVGPFSLYVSGKSFPVGVDRKMGNIIPKDTDFYCVCYRHYFNPLLAENATCFYWQKQENDTVIYLDYHKNVDKDLVKLPKEFVGKKLEIVEKTPSVTLHTKDAISEKGIEVSVTDGYGYIVLKVL